MKKANIDLLKLDDFWANNNKYNIRVIVKRFIKDYLELKSLYEHYKNEYDKLYTKEK